MARGRPKIIDEKIENIIIQELQDGKPLSRISDDEGMPGYSTIKDHIRDNPDFSAKYERAREIGLDKSFEDMLQECDIALADDPKKAPLWKLYIDTKKWTLSKQLPKKYGDRVENVLKTVDESGNDKGIDFRTMTSEELVKLVSK